MFVEVHGRPKNGRCRWGLGLLAAAVVLSVSGCGGGGGGSSSGGGGTTNTPPVTTPSVTQAIPAAGAALSLPLSSASALSVNFPSGAVPANTPVTVTQVPQAALPVSIAHLKPAKFDRSRLAARTSKGAAVTPHFTLSVNNVYIVAFQISASGVTLFNVPVTLTGGNGLTPAGLPANTVLNIAQLQNGGYVDVATVTTTPTGGFTQQQVSSVLPGITQPGTYVVYQPAQGTNTTVANFGIALIADDSHGTGALQVVNLFDSAGAPLATPALTSLAFSSAYDLDGQALTPDGSQGILVDGGNTVRFFSQVNSGVPIASTNTVDISNYGSDGDSVAILPNGDESVVSGDTTELLVISGILGGSPQTATTIPLPDVRDGVVISNDGKALLARGPSGLTVFAVAGAAPTTGSLGGSISHTFTQTADIATAGTGGSQEDGRDGMAFSPTDSSRAVVIGDSTGAPTVSLLTGLPGSPVVANIRLRLPTTNVRHAERRAEGGKHPHLALAGVSVVSSVAITPDGKTAIIGTDAGLALVSGVDTGILAQVGTPFNPAFTVSGTNYNLAGIPTLGITLDGKYVVALTPQPTPNSGTLLTIPIQSGSFGAPVGQLNGVAVPDNDQLLIH